MSNTSLRTKIPLRGRQCNEHKTNIIINIINMKGHDLSFTIPKPYLIGGLSTIVMIYPITNTIHYLLWLFRYSKYFGNICMRG